MFLHLVGGVMSVVVGRGWSARFGGLAWCGVFVFPGSSFMISLGVLVAVKGGLRPSLGRFACRSPYDSTGTPRGGALPITGKAALLKYTEENGLMTTATKKSTAVASLPPLGLLLPALNNLRFIRQPTT